ncbi:uncharacterized protein LOC109840888 isoform X1 [Asparagus officinalis]|nr:uncharacterized protein LOC109840888 isoform X1 [Asparagus officinalis]XP_020265296.1 uncharacterized protein LOC109840888 isoform X1 [Asparagus officinalis]
MSEIPRDNTASPKQNEFSPNYFAYYKHVILDLLSENGTCFLPSMEVDSAVPVGMGCGSSSYFSEAVAVGLSEFKKERLLATLNESSSCFNREADEILEHILAAKDIDSNLREKEHDGSYSKAASEEDLDMPLYKRKRKSHPDNIKYSSGNSVSFKQVYKTIQALQGEDEICHEDVEKYTSQLLAKLDKMEESLEDYLNTVVSTCRPMTCIEKHRLGKQIRKLPAKALDRVVEILQPSNFSANNLPETVFVNLEEQDDVKLWRVYYYVELVAKTNKLCI